MRPYDAATIAALTAPGIGAELLIWIVAKNRGTGLEEPKGFWTGPDDQSFNPGGGARLYHGAGTVLGTDNFSYAAGQDVISHNLTLNMADSNVQALILGSTARLAVIEIHRALFDLNGNLVGVPHAMLIGHVDEEPNTIPQEGPWSVQIKSVPISRMLTVTMDQKQSDAAQRERSGDRIFRYNAISRIVDEPFGTGKLNGGAGGGGGGGGGGRKKLTRLQRLFK